MPLSPALLTLLRAALALTLHGHVAVEGSPQPAAGVLVEEAEGGARAWSDSLGAYTLPALAPGTHTLRFSRIGLEDRTVQVVVRADTAMQLDVSLRPRPLALGAVRVRAAGARDAFPAAGDG
ncbi:MAG: CarboxypepD reg-like domain, partial [Gemmatimonadetes bacterium]|nr:CarboxypepD reg-like domain [Gemmatimonadota bacterium]